MIRNSSTEPFIRKFNHKGFFYIYDVFTNQIVEVEKPVYQIIDDYDERKSVLIEAKFKDTFEISTLRSSIEKIKNAKEQYGLFSNFKPQKITMGIRRTESIKKLVVSIGLGQLLLEVTRSCNLDCSYCPASGRYSNKKIKPVHLSREICMKAVDFFCQNSQNSESPFISFYGGEPLKRFDFIKETIEYVKHTYGKDKYKFNITTNGTLLNKKIIDFFIENDFLLMISLDGPLKKNDRYRLTRDGKGTFHTIMKNLEYLNNYDSDYFSERVSISSVLAPPFDDFEETLKFFSTDNILSEINRKGRIRTSLIDTRGTSFIEDFGLEESMEGLNRIQSRLIKRLKEAILDHRLPDFSIEKNTIYPVLENLARRPVKRLNDYMTPLGACHIGLRRLFVRTNGDFYICERSGDDYKIGSVDNGFDYERIAGYYRKLEEVLEDCKNCWAIHHCERCWVQMGNLDEFNGKKKEEFCSFNKGMIETAFKVYVELLQKDPDCLKILETGKEKKMRGK